MKRAKIPLPTPIMIDISSQTRYEETTLQTCDTDVKFESRATGWKVESKFWAQVSNTSTYVRAPTLLRRTSYCFFFLRARMIVAELAALKIIRRELRYYAEENNKKTS